jgi:tetratricopeptide (TPR) repeat protein
VKQAVRGIGKVARVRWIFLLACGIAIAAAVVGLVRRAERGPRTLAERLQLAQAAREHGRFEEALGFLPDVVDSDHAASVIWRTRGVLEFERDRAGPAESALLKALVLDPKLSEARRDLVNLCTIEGRRSELAAQFRALAETTPPNFEDMYLWCLGRRLEVGPAHIAVRLQRMLENDPADRYVRLALAENLRRLGRLDEAEACLRPLPAGDVQALAARALLALDRGDVQAAARSLADGPPDHPELARLRGRIALAKGDPAAVEAYRLALKAEPEDRDLLFGLGQALRLAGQPEAARKHLDAAFQRDRLEWLIQNARSLSKRDDPTVLCGLGDACRSLHRLPEARGWYRLALFHGPGNGEIQKSLSAVDAALAREAPRAEAAAPRK